MSRLKTLSHSYLFFLAFSFILAAGAWKLDLLPARNAMTASPSMEAFAPAKPPPDTADEASVLRQEDNTIQAEIPQILEESETLPDEPVFFTADRSYFEDALFIGDSRTVGLYEYGDLGNAVVLADSGMNLYKVWNRAFPLPDGEKQTLEEILTQQTFGKIYLMLGINELGYDFDQTVKRYENVVTQIEAWQPQAELFLQANLHITREKSEQSEIFTNENINRFNTEVQRIAEEGSHLFLDVNELFDDADGCLSEEYTVDDAHVLGKYYADWVDWLLEHAVDSQ